MSVDGVLFNVYANSQCAGDIMTTVYLNQIATAVPDYDVHEHFINYAPSFLKSAPQQALFKRMASRAQIEHRYSFFKPAKTNDFLDGDGFYGPGQFPDTAKRMQFYQQNAFELVKRACDQLDLADITHIIVISCTGFYAPGIDTQITQHYHLNSSVERTMISFMGCSAAFNGLKQAWHIVRSQPAAKVLIVNIELCTLHLQQTDKLEELLSFLIFADGCAASIISAKPHGLAITHFHTALLPNTNPQLTWQIGQHGFDMVLAGQVPHSIAQALPQQLPNILNGISFEAVKHWAVHPGGRSILDAVEVCLGMPPDALQASRDILRQYGNISSATIMFVLQLIMHGNKTGQGCAMAFGPGITLESMLFQC